MSEYDDLIVGLQGKNPSSNNIFSPRWNLAYESRISGQEVVMEFSRHAFHKETVAEMDLQMNRWLISWSLPLPKVPFFLMLELITSDALRV